VSIASAVFLIGTEQPTLTTCLAEETSPAACEQCGACGHHVPIRRDPRPVSALAGLFIISGSRHAPFRQARNRGSSRYIRRNRQFEDGHAVQVDGIILCFDDRSTRVEVPSLADDLFCRTTLCGMPFERELLSPLVLAVVEEEMDAA